MSARLSVDPDSLHRYSSACVDHAADLTAAAARLRALGPGADLYGPVGARFVAALTRAAECDAEVIATLSGSLSGGARAAATSATAYQVSDDAAATWIAGVR